MRYLLLSLLTGFFCIGCQTKKETAENHNHPDTEKVQTDTLKKSIPKEVHANVGDAHITIKYTAPNVRGRVIWGGLVPYNDVWVTGAHRATSFEIDKSFMIKDQVVSAGKYAIFTIPGEENWTIILNKNWDQHLADDYDASKDIVRMTITPEWLDEHQERLSFSIRSLSDDDGVLEFRWEELKVSVPITMIKN
jgi:hypothetical protein